MRLAARNRREEGGNSARGRTHVLLGERVQSSNRRANLSSPANTEVSGLWLLPDYDDFVHAGRSVMIKFAATATASEAVEDLEVAAHSWQQAASRLVFHRQP